MQCSAYQSLQHVWGLLTSPKSWSVNGDFHHDILLVRVLLWGPAHIGNPCGDSKILLGHGELRMQQHKPHNPEKRVTIKFLVSCHQSVQFLFLKLNKTHLKATDLHPHIILFYIISLPVFTLSHPTFLFTTTLGLHSGHGYQNSTMCVKLQ